MTTTDPHPPATATAWCRAESVLWRRTLDGVVVLPASGGDPVALRGPAATIWELLAHPRSTSDLVATLADMYGVRAEQVANDVGGALDVLLELGALCLS